jgi:hypothetical protein
VTISAITSTSVVPRIDDLIHERSKLADRVFQQGRFGSGIDLFSEEFDRKVSFARSSTADRIAERQDTVEF